ncbi:hypothetical protein AYX07_02705 [Thermoactinomyces sp. AS95]|nr:hypothetical protein AYX07_02705 [Thermoactinomyces sp. AS95]
MKELFVSLYSFEINVLQILIRVNCYFHNFSSIYYDFIFCDPDKIHFMKQISRFHSLERFFVKMKLVFSEFTGRRV